MSDPTTQPKKTPSSTAPEWAEGGAAEGFATRVMDGVKVPESWQKPRHKRRVLTSEELVEGVLHRNRTRLGQAITLIESNAPRHLDKAQEMLQHLLPHSGNSIRIGITGVPGAGKSTFINAFGTMLCQKGHRVAVLAIDPSSDMTGGSILGDKTRMEELVREENSFIRPSPSSGTLGGVNRKTRETMLVCEAAGYDVILIETVGVGQSEATVRSMSDFFLLLTLTGAGDDLQNIKRGVMENADAILINKADKDNRLPAMRLRSEIDQALHYLTPPTPGWQPKAYTASALENEGLEEIWDVIQTFRLDMETSEYFDQRRQEQVVNWMMSMVHEQLLLNFKQDPDIIARLPRLRDEVSGGALPATAASKTLLNLYLNKLEQKDHDTKS